MAKQAINFGTTINDGTGDTLRVGAQKINQNFTELYDAITSEGTLSVVSKITAGNGMSVSNPYGPVTINALPASTTQAGVVIVGSGLSVTDGVLSASSYTLPKAASNILGGIKVGNNLTIDSEGVLSAVPQNYTLPTASISTLGGVKVGTGLNIVDGVLNVVNSEAAAVLVNGDYVLSLSETGSVNVPISTVGRGKLETSSGLDVTINEGETSFTWTFGENGELTTAGGLRSSGQIYTNSGILWENGSGAVINNNSIDEYFIIATNTNIGTQYNWTFGYNGNLTFPGGAVVSNNNNDLIISAPEGQPIVLRTDFGDLVVDANGITFPDDTTQTTAFLGVSPPDVTVSSLDNGEFSLVLNADGSTTVPGALTSSSIMTLEAITDLNATAGEDVVITASVGFALRNYSITDGISIITALGNEAENTWVFKPNGELQLPAGGTIVDSNGNTLVQEGFRVVTAPTTSKGYAGNVIGDIAFTSSNYYYCTVTYDGITDIWVKTAWQTTGTWTEEGEGGGIE